MYSQRGKIRIPSYVFILLLAVILGGYLFSGGLAGVNARALEHAVEAIPEESTQVSLNELVPFEWDEVYTFGPYTSKEEIQSIIRLDSDAVKESVSEGMVQLVFVEWGKERVVASVCIRITLATISASLSITGTRDTACCAMRTTPCSPKARKTA